MTREGIGFCLAPVRRAGWLQPGPNSFVRQRRHQSLGVEHRAVAEHEIDGTGQFDGQHRVGLELVAQLGFQARGQRTHDFVVALGNHRRLPKSPAQIRVAQFGAAQSFDLAGAGHRAFDQAAVGHEILDGGETLDVADFVEERQPQMFADAGNGLEQGVVAPSRGLGELLELGFQGGDLGVVMADQGQIVLEGEAGGWDYLPASAALLPSDRGWSGPGGGSDGCRPVDGIGCGPAVQSAARRTGCVDAAAPAAAVWRRDRHRPAG